jgi:hypothetical protein
MDPRVCEVAVDGGRCGINPGRFRVTANLGRNQWIG